MQLRNISQSGPASEFADLSAPRGLLQVQQGIFRRALSLGILSLGLVGWGALALASSPATFSGHPLVRDPRAPSHEEYEEQEKDIPRKPSMPPDLVQRTPPPFSHCERYFVFQGKKIECDSAVGGDAEMLRPIMRDVPAAIAELDAYKRANKNVRIAAYVGTAGILATILGGVISHPIVDSSGTLQPGGYITFTGIALAVNAVIYGLSLVKTNEVHIGNAVRYYNQAHPEKPVELLFSTQVHF